MRIQMGPDAKRKILRAAQPHLSKLEQELTVQAQKVIGQVIESMSGRPADEVMTSLRNGLTSVGIKELHEDVLRAYAERIADGDNLWPGK